MVRITVVDEIFSVTSIMLMHIYSRIGYICGRYINDYIWSRHSSKGASALFGHQFIMSNCIKSF